MSLKNFLRLLKPQRGIDFYLKICLIIVGKVFGQFTDQNRPKTMISPPKSHTKIFWMVLGFWGIYHTEKGFGQLCSRPYLVPPKIRLDSIGSELF